MDHPWVTHGRPLTPIEDPWKPVGDPRATHGCPRNANGRPMAFQESPRRPIRNLRGAMGDRLVECSWATHARPMEAHGRP